MSAPGTPARGLFQRFESAWVLDGVRTPMVDYQGAFADANPIDLGIHAARAVLARCGVGGAEVDSVLAGNMAPGGFDQYMLPRHVGLYAYRVGFLKQFPTLAASPLETIESLEQLRVLWHGHRIAVHISAERPGPGVDTPADLARVRALMRAAPP